MEGHTRQVQEVEPSTVSRVRYVRLLCTWRGEGEGEGEATSREEAPVPHPAVSTQQTPRPEAQEDLP